MHSGNFRNPEGSPSSLNISSLLSPGIRANNNDPNRPNHFDDTFPSAICGTIGYGHVGNGDSQPNNPNKAMNQRVSREQRRMRHQSMGNPNAIHYGQFESGEQLRQAPPGSIIDIVDPRRPVNDRLQPLPLTEQEQRNFVRERRPTGRFGMGDHDAIHALHQIQKRDSSPQNNYPLQRRTSGPRPNQVSSIPPSAHLQIGYPESLAPQLERRYSPNEEYKNTQRRNRAERSQNEGSCSPTQGRQAPLTPEQDQTLKNFITQLSPMKRQPSDPIMPIIDRTQVKDIAALRRNNKRQSAPKAELTGPKQTFGVGSAQKPTQQPLQMNENIDEFRPMIESPKYIIDEPLTLGITSSGSHLKDSFGAKPIHIKTRQESPNELNNSGRRLRSQRSRDRINSGSPTDEYIPHKKSILQALPGYNKVTVNQVRIEQQQVPLIAKDGMKLQGFQSPEDVDQKPHSQRFSSIIFEEKKGSPSPLKHSQTMRKASLPVSTHNQQDKSLAPSFSPRSNNLASSERIPNSAYETPQNTAPTKLQKLSKFKELEIKFRQSMNAGGANFKSIDYRLINQLQIEAAKVIQRYYRGYRGQNKKVNTRVQRSRTQVIQPPQRVAPTLSGRQFANQNTSPTNIRGSPPARVNHRDECLNTDVTQGKCCCTCHNRAALGAQPCPTCGQMPFNTTTHE